MKEGGGRGWGEGFLCCGVGCSTCCGAKVVLCVGQAVQNVLLMSVGTRNA